MLTILLKMPLLEVYPSLLSHLSLSFSNHQFFFIHYSSLLFSVKFLQDKNMDLLLASCIFFLRFLSTHIDFCIYQSFHSQCLLFYHALKIYLSVLKFFHFIILNFQHISFSFNISRHCILCSSPLFSIFSFLLLTHDLMSVSKVTQCLRQCIRIHTFLLSTQSLLSLLFILIS